MTPWHRRALLAALIAAGAAARLWFALRVPELDNDSAALLLAANNLAEHGLLTSISPLPTVLIAALIKLFGFNVLWGRLPELLASLGSLLLAYAIGRRIASERAGLYAVAALAPLPLAVFFAGISKEYSLGAFLLHLALWLCLLGQQARPRLYGALAGASLAAAFATKTFLAFAAAPLLLLAVALSLIKKGPGRWSPAPLWWSLVAFAALLLPLIAWRLPDQAVGWRDYAMSVLNDYEVDWLTHYSWQAWSGRWIGLVSFHALGLALLPAGGLAGWLLIGREHRDARALLALFVLANLAVLLLNPVNHFPRTALPLALPLAVFCGVALDNAPRPRLARAMPFGLLAAALCAALLFFRQRLGAQPLLIDFVGLTTAHQILAACVIFLVLSALGALLAAALLRRERPRLGVAVAVAALLLNATWSVPFAFDSARRQLAQFGPRLQAALASYDAHSVGGTDLVMLDQPWSIPTLVDLPRERLAELVSGHVRAALDPLELRTLVLSQPLDGHEATVFELFARDLGREPVDLGRRLWEREPEIDRVFDNGFAAAYQLRAAQFEAPHEAAGARPLLAWPPLWPSLKLLGYTHYLSAGRGELLSVQYCAPGERGETFAIEFWKDCLYPFYQGEPAGQTMQRELGPGECAELKLPAGLDPACRVGATARPEQGPALHVYVNPLSITASALP